MKNPTLRLVAAAFVSPRQPVSSMQRERIEVACPYHRHGRLNRVNASTSAGSASAAELQREHAANRARAAASKDPDAPRQLHHAQGGEHGRAGLRQWPRATSTGISIVVSDMRPKVLNTKVIASTVNVAGLRTRARGKPRRTRHLRTCHRPT
jgi:hypothetical protein